MRQIRAISLFFFACLGFMLTPTAYPFTAAGDPGQEYDRLVDLYDRFRDFRFPEVTDGVPDYTPAAMSEKFEGLKDLQQKLADIDTSGWDIPKQVDYHIVKSEMNAMEFNHRVMRPWSRDPAFYAVITFQFGPKMHRSVNMPDIPMPQERMTRFRSEMEAIPKILQQARKNLTEPKGDLAYIGIHTKNREIVILNETISRLREHHPDLVPPALDALESLRRFKEWLHEIRPALEPHAGIGVNNYNWYLKNVALLPYTWDEILVLARREYEEAIASMKLKEYGNRHIPDLEPVDNREDYVRRYNNALKHLYGFLHKQQLFTVPEYFEAPEPAERYSRGEERDYFANILDRYPLPLSAHGFAGHDLDAQRSSRDERPIRGESRQFFVEGIRAEALATGLEKFLPYTGLIDEVPRAEELFHNLKAFRAIRAVSDLRMHANERSFEEAFQYNIDYTPHGWVPEDSPTLWHDLELYLRTPGYGMGYVIGPILIERLMTECITQQGDTFDMQVFMDRFMETGFMQIPLIRWEMTGRRPSEPSPYWK